MGPLDAPRPEHVVLVNERDEAIGTMEKMEAHRLGKLHRAFSIFLFDREGRVLLQRRALGKYHSPGLWSNACCSHPRPEESVLAAATRRMREELGASCELTERFAFIYHAHLGNGLQEHEYDHVLFGSFNEEPRPDPAEVMAVRWITPDELDVELTTGPGRFTPWLAVCWEQVRAHAERGVQGGNGSNGPSGRG